MPENEKTKKDGTVAKDQKERGYYYDDAHGYEEYDPEEEDDDDKEKDRSEQPTDELPASEPPAVAGG